MRIFYEAWCGMFENRPSATADLQKSIIPVGDSGHIEIRPLTTDELTPETLEAFLAVGFTNSFVFSSECHVNSRCRRKVTKKRENSKRKVGFSFAEAKEEASAG